jgi:hypothetical protein
MILDFMTYSLAAVVIVVMAVVLRLALRDKAIDSNNAEHGNDNA